MAKEYKIFDGTTWVSPCDQEIRMLMPDGVTWRLIDPINEDVKYFDGVSWKPMICVDPVLCPNCVASDVTIGSQIWTKCNADISKYRDGTDIPEVSDPTTWINLTTGAWCYYNNDSANGPKYGKLYNWYAVAGIWDAASLSNPALRKEFAPAGYHVPSDTEWSTLRTYLGGVAAAGIKIKEAGLCHWSPPNTGATNSSGFTGLPGGIFNYQGVHFDLGLNGYWWTSTQSTGGYAWNYPVDYWFGNLNRSSSKMTNGFSVRFIKD